MLKSVSVCSKKLYNYVLSALPPSARRAIMFTRTHHRLPNFSNPSSFSEKLVWRMLYDRREQLSWTCDKMEMKKRVALLDPKISPVPTIWSGTNLNELIDMDLGDRWVLKPNHLSGRVHIGRGAPVLSEFQKTAMEWLDVDEMYNRLDEWPYAHAEPKFIVEPWIGDPSGDDVPDDYKFFTFDGKTKLIQVHKGRGANHRQYHFTPDWDLADVWTSLTGTEVIERPDNLDEMIRQAEIIGKDFDFIRVDFYNVGFGVLFGETTPFPANAQRRFHPYSFDKELGKNWILPRNLK